MFVSRVDEAAGLALVERASQRRSEWRWVESLQPDPLEKAFHASQEAGTLLLEWNRCVGRRVCARRKIQRGELLMNVPALAFAALHANAATTGQGSSLNSLGMDETTVQLVIAATTSADSCRTVRALMLHAEAEYGSDSQRHALATELAARMGDRSPVAQRGIEPAELCELALRVKTNQHRAMDDESASRCVGVGLYPAACLLNHSCLPTACLSWSRGGQMLHVRALCDIAAGEEVTCSYLSEEQLYTSWEERRALLKAAHHFEPIEPDERKVAEQEARADGGVEQRLACEVHDAVARTHRAVASGSPASLDAALDSLLALIEQRLQPCLHPFHVLVQEAHGALLSLARALDHPPLVAKAALHLLTAREHTLPRGTLHLSSLYAAHAGALLRLLREGEIGPAERARAAETAAASMRAAHRIRVTCIGALHPLTRSTALALERAESMAERR